MRNLVIFFICLNWRLHLKNFEPIEIPDEQIAFAEAVSKLAEENGIDKFTMKYEPEWRDKDRRVSGEIQIYFRAKDGRGRPCRNLSFSLTANHTMTLEYNQESCS